MTHANIQSAKRTKPARQYDIDDVKFVFDHYSQMSTPEIAEARHLATFQVTQIVNHLRKQGAKVPKKRQTDIIADFVKTLKASQKA